MAFISCLLIRNPNLRINSATLAKQHAYFKSIDFDKVFNKLYIPPFIPKLKSSWDLHYIDPNFKWPSSTMSFSSPSPSSSPSRIKDHLVSPFEGETTPSTSSPLINHKDINKMKKGKIVKTITTTNVVSAMDEEDRANDADEEAEEEAEVEEEEEEEEEVDDDVSQADDDEEEEEDSDDEVTDEVDVVANEELSTSDELFMDDDGHYTHPLQVDTSTHPSSSHRILSPSLLHPHDPVTPGALKRTLSEQADLDSDPGGMFAGFTYFGNSSASEEDKGPMEMVNDHLERMEVRSTRSHDFTGHDDQQSGLSPSWGSS
ncbi:hypothetical protein HMI55_000444 [Coelomomyces lativittatus]|nr:hypothetical protein HMI55_000444 [Coelomomyces lativittatus]